MIKTKGVAKQDRNFIILVIRNPNVGSFIKVKRGERKKGENETSREII